MATISTRLEVDPERFALVVDGASVGLVNTILRRAKKTAEQLAPYSDNTIRKRPASQGIRGQGNHTITLATRRTKSGSFGNKAPHSRIVHEGRKPIKSSTIMVIRTRGGALPSRKDRPRGSTSQRVIKTFKVGGASAQPWLVDAYNRAINSLSVRRVKPMSRVRTPA